MTAKAVLDLIIHVSLWFRPTGRIDASAIADHYGILALQLVCADPVTAVGAGAPPTVSTPPAEG